MDSFDYQLNQWLWLLYFTNGTKCFSSTFYLFSQWLVSHDLNGKSLNEYQRIGAIDAKGQITRYELGNGITVNKAYNAATGLLERVNSNRFDLSEVQDLEYKWDDIGNLEYRIERSGSKDLRENFEYDDLNRLTKSTTQSNGQTLEQALTYDLLGNITYKSDVGHYSYGAGTAGPHALTQAGTVTFTYDNNGNNISSSDGRVLEYSTFDKVTKVTKGEFETTFVYGPERSRYKRVDTNSNTGEVKTTYYLGSVERIEYSGGQRSGEREYKRSLGMAIETILYKNNEIDQQETHYLLHDHLGSIDVITDSLANIVQEMSFDAWGQRRNASSWDKLQGSALTQFDTDITTRGFTGHEMVDGVGIIHMNGRIYDAKLARFLQADPHIQEPYLTQSLNRYSYVLNNPLNATDPSGYFFFSIIAGIGGLLASTATFAITTAIAFVTVQAVYFLLPPEFHAFLNIIATAVSAYFCGPCAIGTAALGSFHSNFSQTGDLGAAFESGAISGATAAAFYGVGKFLSGVDSFTTEGVNILNSGLNSAGYAAKVALHGLVGGLSSVAQGGKFGQGFAAAGISAAATGGYKVSKSGATAQGVILSSVVGGTASKITGGKFANGATTGAFGYILNSSLHVDKKQSTSKSGIKAITKHEGFRSKVYKDGAGHKTIGYGHKLTAEEIKNETYSSGISKEDALTLLRQDVRTAENVVRNSLTVSVTQNQFDALVSLTYNIGGGNFRSSTLLTHLNAGNYLSAASQFHRWNKIRINGVKTPSSGLSNRRASESCLFSGQC